MTFFPYLPISIVGVAMPIVIRWDPAYALLFLAHETVHLDNSKEKFNYQLSKCRMTMQHAIGRLKDGWRYLMTGLHLGEPNFPDIAACCFFA